MSLTDCLARIKRYTAVVDPQDQAYYVQCQSHFNRRTSLHTSQSASHISINTIRHPHIREYLVAQYLASHS